MAIASRQAETVWEGSLGAGQGILTSQSGAIDGLPVTWAARTEAPGGKTSPEELAAAAHSSCFSMALALKLGTHDAEPERVVVRCVVTLEDVQGVPTIVSSELDVTARVPGLDADGFASIVAEAAELCPVSRLFAGARVRVRSALIQQA